MKNKIEMYTADKMSPRKLWMTKK